jgi:hypothetical protein
MSFLEFIAASLSSAGIPPAIFRALVHCSGVPALAGIFFVLVLVRAYSHA